MIGASKDSAFGGRLRFLGSRRDVPNLLATMDVFCLPSRAEPFGVVVIEALAAGLPVVASRVGGIPEILGTASGITVPPGSAHGFVDALSRLAMDIKS